MNTFFGSRLFPFNCYTSILLRISIYYFTAEDMKLNEKVFIIGVNLELIGHVLH